MASPAVLVRTGSECAPFAQGDAAGGDRAAASLVPQQAQRPHSPQKQKHIRSSRSGPSTSAHDVASLPKDSATSAMPRKYQCNFPGCGRTFPRVAKLEDHERIHSGERPFHCDLVGCGKSFRRADHLQRHARSHLAEATAPTSASCLPGTKGKAKEERADVAAHHETASALRPFVCHLTASGSSPYHTTTACGRRFLTQQHLRRHMQEVHDIESHAESEEKDVNGKVDDSHLATLRKKRTPRAASYFCTIGDCDAVFHKRKLLRSHVNIEHSDRNRPLDGIDKAEAARIARLPFPCTHAGCSKRFPTNAKRMAHAARHADPARYVCTLPHKSSDSTVQFATWSELQAHHRDAHKPTCPYSGCTKTFAEPRNLRLHLLKVHGDGGFAEGSEGDFEANDGSMAFAGNAFQLPSHICGWTAKSALGDTSSLACTRTFPSRHACNLHVRNAHLGEHPYVCKNRGLGCERRFSSKRGAGRHGDKCPLGDTTSIPESADMDDFFRREGGAVPEEAADRPRARKRSAATEDADADEKAAAKRRQLHQSGALLKLLTGSAYAQSTTSASWQTPSRDDETRAARRQRGRVLACPWARICALRDERSERRSADVCRAEASQQATSDTLSRADVDGDDEHGDSSVPAACHFRFSRLYDVQRHLRATHGLELAQADIRVLLDKDEQKRLGAPRPGTQAAQPLGLAPLDES